MKYDNVLQPKMEWNGKSNEIPIAQFTAILSHWNFLQSIREQRKWNKPNIVDKATNTATHHHTDRKYKNSMQNRTKI